MKKPTKKKLSLSRETVATLEARDLEQVMGGGGIVSSDNKSCTYSRLVTGCSC